VNPLPVPPLLVITDRRQARRPLDEVAAAAFAGGCRWLSLREKDLQADERRAILDRILAAAAPYGATVIVHDDLAAARRCAGVHLPAGSDPTEARRLLGAGALIGQSAHSVEAAVAAECAGADYVTLSPIFITASKPGYGPALGPEILSRARTTLTIPVLALGGVDAGTIAACLSAGAAGAAVMGPVMRSEDPAATVRDLIALAAG